MVRKIIDKFVGDKEWGLSEKEKKLLDKELKHNTVDAEEDVADEQDSDALLVKLAFPNLDKKEQYKIYSLMNTKWNDGYNLGSELEKDEQLEALKTLVANSNLHDEDDETEN